MNSTQLRRARAPALFCLLRRSCEVDGEVELGVNHLFAPAYTPEDPLLRHAPSP